MPFDFAGKRVLVFVVAYNAEKTLASVLNRIPTDLRQPGMEVLVIDDFSRDETFSTGMRVHEEGLKVTMLRTPENQGYGGNQKLGYHYAIEHGFDIVALLHGDGQYAPEKLGDLLEPLVAGEADAVFGSRMMHKADALKGGMPLYKWVGNQVLTTFQNWMLGSRLSEFHSGYRLYSVEALKQIPFERNSNDFHFDTEIIVQFVLQGLNIVERPIPTFYGDEICHVDGFKYAWDVVKTMLGCKAHGFGLLYDRRFDVPGSPLGRGAAPGPLKLGYPSSHTLVLEAARPGGKVLVWGTESAALLAPLARRGICAESAQGETVPPDLSAFPQIFLLEALEHFAEPEHFVEALRAAACRTRPEITVTTPNIGFFIPRLMLLVGEFNYSRRGILDRGHRRLFTFRSLRALLRQAGYTILETRGLPAPFPKAIGDNFLSRALLRVNQALIWLAPGLFSYEIVLKVQAHPTVHTLLDETAESSRELARQLAPENP